MAIGRTAKRKITFPHTYVLLVAIMVVAAIASWLIPAGEYDRVDLQGRQVIDPDTYHRVPSNPAGVVAVVSAFPKALVEVADIVFYIFIIGGAFAVLNRTGTIRAGIEHLVRRIGRREWLVVPSLTLLFAIGGGSIGIAEETLVFLPTLYLLARSLGYDSLIAGGVALVGAGAGFSAAFMNPFTVGVAQGIVGLPLFSGMEFRIVLWLCFVTVSIAFLTRYAARVKADPSASSMYEIDRQRELPVDSAEDSRFTKRHLAVLSLCLAALCALVVGATSWNWGILELSALFFALAVVAGPLGGLTANETARSFVAGAADMTYAGLVVGLARGSLVVLREASVIDTITQAMAAAVSHWPVSISVLGVYLMQCLLNFIVPSGSGQAAVSLPVLAPFGDLLGITRQTTVLAYQLGDGMSNILTPTSGYFMAALGILKIPWSVWVRWMLPLFVAWFVMGSVAMLVAHAMQLGPF